MHDPLPMVDLPEYSTRLYERLTEGTIVPPAAVSIGAWTPAPGDCHANVSTWCKNIAEYKAVRGWLYFDLANAMPFVLFNAHSVVRDPSGKLWDITPSQASQPYPFIPAEESEEEYAHLVESGVVRIRHSK
jgi:hypothetical protein